jgi:hypothetical protein
MDILLLTNSDFKKQKNPNTLRINFVFLTKFIIFCLSILEREKNLF